MKLLKSGDLFVHKLNNGEGMLYKITEDPISPLALEKTLSPNEVKEIETKQN